MEAVFNMEVENMPPERSQDNVGFCYGFIGTALAEWLYCSSISGCENKIAPDGSLVDHRLSLLSVSSKIYETAEEKDNPEFQRLFNGGGRGMLLRGIQKSPMVFLESCAPFDRLINNQVSRPRLDLAEELKKNANWFKLQNKYGEFRRKLKDSKNEDSEIDCFVRSIKNDPTLRITGEFDSIFQAAKDSLMYGSDEWAQESPNKKWSWNQIEAFGIFATKAYINSGCYEKSITIPPFEVKGLKTTKENALHEKILEVVGKNKTPISAGTCIEPNDLEGNSCRDHAVIIGGVRKFCCEEDPSRCHYQYKVRDSFEHVWIESDEEGWVDSQKIMPHITRYGKVREGWSGVNTLDWIVPKK